MIGKIYGCDAIITLFLLKNELINYYDIIEVDCTCLVELIHCYELLRKAFTNVLVLNSYKLKRSMTIDTTGTFGQHDCFRYGDQTSTHESCSLTFQNQFYVFGGAKSENQERQLSKVIDHRLERIGSLDFEFDLGKEFLRKNF